MTTEAGTQRPKCLVVAPGLSGNAGDSVVLRHVAKALSEDFELSFVQIESVGRVDRLISLTRLNLPLELLRYDGAVKRKRLVDALAAEKPDMVLLLHEGAFLLLDEVKKAGLPCLLYPHNVHTLIGRTDPYWLSRVFLGPTTRFERKRYGDLYAAMVCISEADRLALEESALRAGETPVAPPGMPPLAPLSPDAVLSPEIVLTGSYGWWRKWRSLQRFARSPGELPSPALVTDERALGLLGASARLGQPQEVTTGKTVQFGLITDYFTGGFKLKSIEYVAMNCIVLACCDISMEFAGIPDGDVFVRRVASKADVRRAIEAFQAEPERELVERFARFRAACAERFEWTRSLKPLTDAVAARLAAQGEVRPARRIEAKLAARANA
jgi:hypothetical protein